MRFAGTICGWHANTSQLAGSTSTFTQLTSLLPLAWLSPNVSTRVKFSMRRPRASRVVCLCGSNVSRHPSRRLVREIDHRGSYCHEKVMEAVRLGVRVDERARISQRGACWIARVESWVTLRDQHHGAGVVCFWHPRMSLDPRDVRGVARGELRRIRIDVARCSLLVVLDSLSRAERLAFVLHDMFELPFDAIAPVVGRLREAARQRASRGAAGRIGEAASTYCHAHPRQRELSLPGCYSGGRSVRGASHGTGACT
jgi:hypothetical protein